MRDILKISLGILFAVAVCLAIALPIKARLTPSAYERCNAECEAEESVSPLLFSTADEYVEHMVLVRDVCLKECKGTWGLHDELHWLMGITYR